MTAVPLFQSSRKINPFIQQDVFLYPQFFFKNFKYKDPLAFFQKGEKTAELVFLFLPR